MSEQPTPETDAIVRNAATADHPPTRLAATLTVKCEKLERERDEARADLEFRRGLYKVQEQYLETARRERDEARESLRILAGLVAYGLGQSGEEWSLEAMRQATTAIQNAKSLEGWK